ncbi:MAG: PilZ domain-containing protein [Candidatus Omnitrophica bacterium]|nr:PilZ domain-containing protein [Candidatus Omnitrophota bacterium]
MQEKRKYPRIEKSLSLKLSYTNFDIITETKNISCNGAYCAIDKPIEPMTKLDIVLVFNSDKKNNKKNTKKIHCKGVVVRKELVLNDDGKYIPHIGIYFNEIKERDKKFLASYINSHLKTYNLTNTSSDLNRCYN